MVGCENPSQVVEYVGKVGIYLQGLCPVGDCLADIALLVEHYGHIFVCFDVIGVNSEGLVVVFKGLVEFVLGDQGGGHIVMRIGGVRVKIQGCFELVNSQVCFFLVKK